jgi:hypothetical protein
LPALWCSFSGEPGTASVVGIFHAQNRFYLPWSLETRRKAEDTRSLLFYYLNNHTIEENQVNQNG